MYWKNSEHSHIQSLQGPLESLDVNSHMIQWWFILLGDELVVCQLFDVDKLQVDQLHHQFGPFLQ